MIATGWETRRKKNAWKKCMTKAGSLRATPSAGAAKPASKLCRIDIDPRHGGVGITGQRSSDVDDDSRGDDHYNTAERQTPCWPSRLLMRYRRKSMRNAF